MYLNDSDIQYLIDMNHDIDLFILITSDEDTKRLKSQDKKWFISQSVIVFYCNKKC